MKKPNLMTTFILLLMLPVIIFALYKVYDLRKGASGTPASITVSTQQNVGRLPSTLWQNLAQGGEEAADMIGPVAEKVKVLKPQLIRVDHLFDYYQVYQGPDNYDFSKLDKVVSSILATGAKPLLSISYTTASMAANNQNAGEPKDWNQWYKLVRATANRYSVQQNISGIYYEVWNEPDLFGGWHYGKNPNYITLYSQTSRAIRDGAGQTDYKVGGPAITAYYTNWFKALFRAADANKLPLDFISWHRYSKNMDDYEKDVNSMNDLLSDYPQFAGIERLITEVGPNPEPDIWYDNSLSGIHLISMVTRLAGKIHRIFPFEVVDGPNKRSDGSQGWGMISHPNNGAVIKPRYHAVTFLNKLEGYRLTSAGDGSWVTAMATRSTAKTQVLLVNYDPRNAHTETVPVSFQQLTPGKYKLTTLKYLGSKPTSKTVQTLSSVLTEQVYMEPNSAILLELIPAQ